ncbi:MAG: hypothetical protein AAGM22_07345 [Acidobacteriota bacterium]
MKNLRQSSLKWARYRLSYRLESTGVMAGVMCGRKEPAPDLDPPFRFRAAR